MSDLEPRKILLSQARGLGLDVDGRWSTDTLAEKVEEAQRMHAEQEEKALFASCDTWVYCIRDCFIATEKHQAGSVIFAPEELYRNWKTVGAARLADKDEIAEAKDAAGA
jgi:hypothetical protein